MKVYREGEVFKPITIVLESVEDSSVLWHILNCPTGKSLAEWCDLEFLDYKAIFNYHDLLFNALTDKFTLSEEKHIPERLGKKAAE